MSHMSISVNPPRTSENSLWGANVWRTLSGSRRNAVKRWRVTLGRNWRWWLGWAFFGRKILVDWWFRRNWYFADGLKMISPRYPMYSHVAVNRLNIEWITHRFSADQHTSASLYKIGSFWNSCQPGIILFTVSSRWIYKKSSKSHHFEVLQHL